VKNKERGLYQKYNVERTDGKPCGDCIVLEFRDPNARLGIKAFSRRVRRQGYIPLADDLDEQCYMWDNYDKQIKKANKACLRSDVKLAKLGR